jgi:hypothetical protein
MFRWFFRQRTVIQPEGHIEGNGQSRRFESAPAASALAGREQGRTPGSERALEEATAVRSALAMLRVHASG